jgi:precorrin-6Y C5,15-methyltransferase (decarboxylating)
LGRSRQTARARRDLHRWRTDPALIDKAFAGLKPGGRIVVNAVTLDTEKAVFAAQAKLGGTLTRLSVERLDAVGGKQAFRPAMTVTQWSAVKP